MTDIEEGPELIEMPPESLPDLEELNEDAKTMYVAAPDGGYVLKESARAAIEETNADIQQRWDSYLAGLAERDAKLSAKDVEIRRLAIKRDIGNALTEAGIKTNYFQAAEAVLLDTLDIEVQQNADGSVSTSALGPYGRTQASAGLSRWSRSKSRRSAWRKRQRE
jgi:hypothetical protein